MLSVFTFILEWGLRAIHADLAGTAKRAALQMLEIDPNSVLARVLLSQAERAVGDTAAAHADARRALQIAPQDLGVQLNLWSVLVSAGDTEDALPILQTAIQALRRDPNSAIAKRPSTPGF